MAGDPLIYGLVWVLVAALVSVLPRRLHRWGAVALLVTCLPIVVAIARTHGALAGLAALAAVASVLRWPLLYLGRRIVALGRRGHR